MFTFDPENREPPVNEVIYKAITSPDLGRLSITITKLAEMIYNAPAVRAALEIHYGGYGNGCTDGYEGDAEALVKAAAFDLTMKYSMSMTRDAHTAAMFLTAVSAAVEIVTGRLRTCGIR